LRWHSIWNYFESSARALAVVNHGRGHCSFWPWNFSWRHSHGGLWPFFWLADRVTGDSLGSSVWPADSVKRCSFDFIWFRLLVCLFLFFKEKGIYIIVPFRYFNAVYWSQIFNSAQLMCAALIIWSGWNNF
jgi:hypothetical protein